MVLSLYDVCLGYLADHSAQISDLTQVPFEPFVSDLLAAIYEKPKERLNVAILQTVSRSHGHRLGRSNPDFYTVYLSAMASPQRDALLYIHQNMAQFVCRLDLTFTQLSDQDIWMLKGCIHLTWLDLSCTVITDDAVASLARMADPTSYTSDTMGLRRLDTLLLVGNVFITDASLKYLGKMARLVYIDLTASKVTEAAVSYLCRKCGYQLSSKRGSWKLWHSADKSTMSAVTHDARSLPSTPLRHHETWALTEFVCRQTGSSFNKSAVFRAPILDTSLHTPKLQFERPAPADQTAAVSGPARSAIHGAARALDPSEPPPKAAKRPKIRDDASDTVDFQNILNEYL